jgi:hypothetical protein
MMNTVDGMHRETAYCTIDAFKNINRSLSVIVSQASSSLTVCMMVSYFVFGVILNFGFYLCEAGMNLVNLGKDPFSSQMGLV